MKKTAPLLLLLALLSAAGCSKTAETKNSTQTQTRPAVAVEVMPVASSQLVDGIEVTGSLEPKFSVDVKTQIPGLVQQVYVNEWVRVKKGQLLARIDISETEAMVKRAEAAAESARANLAQAQVGATRSERELARILKLKDSGLATQQSVDDARSEAEATRARIEAAKAQIRVAEEEVRQSKSRQGKGVVHAPFDGIVALRDVNVGDLASDAAAAKPIFRIVDNRLLNLTVSVPSTDSGKVRVGQPLEFTVDSMAGKTFSGKVMYLNPELNPSDRSLKVIAEVRNVPELLKGGLFAKGRIVTGTRNNVLQLPRAALASWDTTARRGSAFVVEGDTARLRNLETGVVSGELVEIVSGLQNGAQVVIRGGFNLKDGDKVALAPTTVQKKP
jgi:RND family efflux transporter MFP subunit